jgi:hypothetical protein
MGCPWGPLGLGLEPALQKVMIEREEYVRIMLSII